MFLIELAKELFEGISGAKKRRHRKSQYQRYLTIKSLLLKATTLGELQLIRTTLLLQMQHNEIRGCYSPLEIDGVRATYMLECIYLKKAIPLHLKRF